ncbi:peptidylprolyl isomerase [Kosmotoga arenicorallina S304]|uniref:Peptidyl-prolyl cis-trans isomerase n=1 Tax=Kosmotoga arenicorallina S304 TaxID=1453497 RepID=A0A176JZX6_9BACT|nr:peptidylprolyl isomerase [Kosmotoga arenicorallina]OAA29712.1 peptidylprolyl isomerase [Kosmotoga arenicorallina S304]
MGAAKKGNTVRVHYTGKFETGEVFDTSVNRNPLEFTVGNGQVIKGFDEAIVGMKVGEKKTVNIPFEEAYGPHMDELVFSFSREDLPEDLNPEIGQRLQMVTGDGKRINVTITAISEKDITLDANHPLAGKNLIFEIELVEILN